MMAAGSARQRYVIVGGGVAGVSCAQEVSLLSTYPIRCEYMHCLCYNSAYS